MRIMAVDYGDARTGIAVSDETGVLAGEAFIIKEWSPERAAEIIADAAQKRRVGRIVLGYPKNMDGTLGPRAEKSEALAALLRNQYKLDVVLWDERRTTADAHRILSEAGVSGKKRRGTVDAVAAALILEGYLNSIR
jgi:putative Holliday junction resolvase